MSEDQTDINRARALAASAIPDDINDAAPEEDLRDYGLDSIRMLDLVTALKQEGVEVEFADLVAEPTLSAIARLISTAGKGNHDE